MNDRYLWAIPDAQTRWLWKCFAEELGRRLNLRPLLIVGSEADRDFYMKQFGRPFEGDIHVLPSVYEVINDQLDGRDEYDYEEILSRASEYEARYGITLMRQLILPDRVLGRAYMQGGLGHPVAKLYKKLNSQTALRACVYSCERIEALAESYPPGMVVKYGAAGGLHHKPIALFCSVNDVPFRGLVASRFGGNYYWTVDEFENSPGIEACMAKLPAADDETINRVNRDLTPNSLATSEHFLADMRRTMSHRHAVRQILYLILQRIYWRLRGYNKGSYTYTLGAVISQHWRTPKHWRRLDREAIRDITSYEGRRLIYVPLQTEPEASISSLTPEHSYQLTTLSEISLAAPADAIIVAKEHIWQMGRRSDGFYEAIRDMPNVVLGHPTMNSLDLIRRSDLVCTITSSAGHEAAALGIPVVYFCKHGYIHGLDHVHACTGLSNIEVIREALAPVNETEREKRRRDGAKYFQAIEAYCVNLDDMEIHGREKEPQQHELDRLIEHLLKTFPAGFDGTAQGEALVGEIAG